MGNSLRCCLACVLPCGALDVVQVVHLSGHVDDVSAGEVMAAHPHHLLGKPCTRGVGVRRIVILPPDSELKRGRIYFLVPSSTSPPEHRQKRKRHAAAPAGTTKKNGATAAATLTRSSKNSVEDDSYSTEIPSGQRSHHHGRRSAARVGVWRPHLESICEVS